MTADRPSLAAVTADLLVADRIESVWTVYGAAIERFGFDRLLYCATRFAGRSFLGNLNEALLLHRGPVAYADVYIDEELYLHSPTVAWAEANHGFISWAEAARLMVREVTPQVMRIARLNAEYGIASGYVGSLNGVVPGIKGVIGLGGRTGLDQAQADAIWAECGGEIETLTKLMHLRIAGLPQPILLRPLTSRQREVLDWYGQGKTTNDIATIMGLSVATVEKHMRAARESLDATTTAHAVKKAAALNLLLH